MSRASQAIKKISPLQTIVFTGAISIFIIIAGSAGFIITQNYLVENVEKKQACYLDLIDFRGRLGEFETAQQAIKKEDNVEEKRESQNSAKSDLLRLMYRKLAVVMQQAGVQPFPAVQSTLQHWPDLLVEKNLDLFRKVLDKSVEQAKIESKEASVKLVVINIFFLFFILAVLLTLSITSGWLLHNNYRQTLIPLAQLVGQLKLLNNNIPESIRDTVEEMKRDLTVAGHSSDIAQITESIMRFCGDIDAKNKKLDEIYIRDEKTNLYNYRHFKEHLIIDIERAKRLGDKVSLVMLDIDNFKLYNDANGHIAGDNALKILADIISSQCRAYDVPSRFGGEEFALLFPKTETEVARDIAERLRKIISEEPFPHEKNQPAGELTVSIGIATFPDDALDWHTLINNADRALYKAKAAGRNKVTVFAAIETDVNEA